MHAGSRIAEPARHAGSASNSCRCRTRRVLQVVAGAQKEAIRLAQRAEGGRRNEQDLAPTRSRFWKADCSCASQPEHSHRASPCRGVDMAALGEVRKFHRIGRVVQTMLTAAKAGSATPATDGLREETRDMQSAARFAIALFIVVGLADLSLAQQRRPSNVPSQNRRPTSSQQGQRVPQQQQQRVANRPTQPQTNQSGQAGQETKQEVLSTIFSQVVVGGLKNPAGVAVQPKSDEVFIADSGAGQIVKLKDVPGAYELLPVITGFPLDTYGKNPTYEIGPLSLAFLNKYTLVVGEGGLPDGQDVVRVYRVPHAGSINASEMQQQLGPLRENAASEGVAGNFFGALATATDLFVTCNGADTNGWIAKAPLSDGEVGELVPFIRTRDVTGAARPAAITLGRQGQIVVSQMGELHTPNDSLLTVYDPKSGGLLMNVATQLHDVTGVAISPQSGRIYAVDFSWMAPEEGGLYRLDLVKDGPETICKPTLLMSLDRPSALAFAPDGTLFITTFGSHTAEAKGGLLVRIYNDSKL